MSGQVRQRFAKDQHAGSQIEVEYGSKDAAFEADKSVELEEREELLPIRGQLAVSKVDLYTVYASGALLVALAVGFLRQAAWCDKFLRLQYASVESPGKYDIGIDDAYIVGTFVVVLCLVRSSLLEFVLKPLAHYKFRISSGKIQQRYGEQSWSMLYYTASWVTGFYLYYHSPYFLNCDHIYLNWPHDKMAGVFKVYYLVQIASWLQQIIVLNVEEKRKDYWQMFAHHIITVALTTGSYYYYFNRIGHVILIIMDVVDILLSSAKILKYCGFSVACDYMFVVFLGFWVVLRHGVYNYILHHAWAKSRGLMQNQRCGVHAPGTRCWTPLVIDIFVLLLAGLQLITVIWSFLIVKVFMKVIRGSGAEDVRSDDEE
ncbi:ADL206Wp [Eremothecium gossypii ATCC 10895]|uniref:ADL206Wp n=1 Tax=Eremothecium gossypii (strain ATCC 10895 / CBS 109.51 / FGSC 9923 / NRRL Y-1056) TaxID=284811 RepID=Q75AX6_EREGS|nr:ADL206Wp [Eremothecium gossypii ATCC 10895]AAS51714.1 ADL206Wp [Eremothecium gossypii ATCC 10895]AEY96011.1 FADL206Wp [Eremothecium gossypii FDAG1]